MRLGHVFGHIPTPRVSGLGWKLPRIGADPLSRRSIMPPCVVAAPAPGKRTLPQAVCPPTYLQTLSVWVTVEYRVG